MSTRISAGDGPVASSTLTSAVVHSSGAVCTRLARFDLPPSGGDTVTVRVTGLPPTLYEESLRGRVVSGPDGGDGAVGPRVTDIRVEFGATLRRGDELPRLRLDLEDAEDRQSRLRDRRERLAAEVAEVAALRAEPPTPRRGDPPRWAPVESILALAGFVDSRLAALHRRLRDVEEELARADHESDVLRHRLAEASSAVDTGRAAPTATALVTLATGRTPGSGPAPDDGKDGPGDVLASAGPEEPDVIELEVEYHVPGATWAPVYQLRLDGRSGAGTLVLRACVAQRSGEDWAGVRLGLSTADLLRRADLPDLRSLRIGRRQEAPADLSWREPPAGLADLFTGYDAAVAPRTSGLPLPPPSAHAPSLPAMLGGFGAAADAFAPAAAQPLAPVASAAPMARSRGTMARKALAAVAPGGAPTGWAEAVESADEAGTAGAAPLAPGADLLDYARLTLAGPDAGEERGTLRPASRAAHPVAAEYRRRAATVSALARPAHAVDVRKSAGSFDYRFDTAAPVDVAADGRWHTVPVSEVPVATEFEYVCVPAVDPAVFGTVLVTNTSPHALLAGPVDVMVDGDFVLTAPLPTLAAGQRQSVGVGVAESVRVARRAHMRESTAGLRGGTTVLDHTVEIDVANRLPYPVVVQVRERVPVSTDKDVRIEEHKARPPWAAAERPVDGQEDDYVRGVRSWRVALEPGSTATLSGGYEIRVPAGKAVVGGNRRN
ncbi:DUF4139 domain-containing protein [Actinacidiphila paucisporea]|uniref:DUF4139 domain-containing protein n=1 Tax=Actinacidiphila paucisporea TaxID=310782 RepID=UPI001F1FCAC1|nr:DUF4139 domain-containing protein [Actinacidiphila paucisporea]